MTKKTIDDPNNVLHYLLTTHAPLINQQIKSLRNAEKLPSETDDTEFHETGMQGLMEAVVKYKPEIGPFANYASQMIRGRIQNHADNMYNIPKHIRMQAKRYSKMQEQPTAAPVKQPQSSQAEPKQPTPKEEHQEFSSSSQSPKGLITP